MNKERIVYFDYLRVFAIMAVVVLHVSALNWNDLSVRSFSGMYLISMTVL